MIFKERRVQLQVFRLKTKLKNLKSLTTDISNHPLLVPLERKYGITKKNHREIIKISGHVRESIGRDTASSN